MEDELHTFIAPKVRCAKNRSINNYFLSSVFNRVIGEGMNALA